jgi:hypothetical protein
MNTPSIPAKRRPPKPATIVASSLVVSGLAGTVVDNNGDVGRALFIAGAVGALYLVGARIWSQVRRRHGPTRVFMRPDVAIAAIALGVTGLTGANFVKSTDGGVSGILNRGFVASFVLAAATFAVATVLTVVNLIRPPKRADISEAQPLTEHISNS